MAKMGRSDGSIGLKQENIFVSSLRWQDVSILIVFPFNIFPSFCYCRIMLTLLSHLTPILFRRMLVSIILKTVMKSQDIT